MMLDTVSHDAGNQDSGRNDCLLALLVLGNELCHVFQCRGNDSGSTVRPARRQLLASFAETRTYGAVTTRPPEALTSLTCVMIKIGHLSNRGSRRLTAMAIQLRYSIPGNTGVVLLGITLTG